MAIRAAKGRKLLSFAAVCVLAALAAALPAEASRHLPSLTPDLAPTPPALDAAPQPARPLSLFTDDDVLVLTSCSERDEKEVDQLLERRRFRLLTAPPSRKLASGVFDKPGERIYLEASVLGWKSHQGVYFLQPDPLGPVDSPNLYQAFGFDAFNVTDPWGMANFGGFEMKHEYYASRGEVAEPTPGEFALFSGIASGVGEFVASTASYCAAFGVGGPLGPSALSSVMAVENYGNRIGEARSAGGSALEGAVVATADQLPGLTGGVEAVAGGRAYGDPLTFEERVFAGSKAGTEIGILAVLARAIGPRISGASETGPRLAPGGGLSRGAELRARYGGISRAELHQRINLRGAVEAVENNALRAADAANGVSRQYGRYGTRAHSYFERFNELTNQRIKGTGFRIAPEEFRLGSPGYGRRGPIVGRRASGSLGLDAVLYDRTVPVVGFDLKTGGASWSATRLAELSRRFGIPLVRIRVP